MLTRRFKDALCLLLTLNVVQCVDLVDLSDPGFIDPNARSSLETSEGLRCGASLSKAAGDMRIHFIDVGQGDAIWIETPDDGDNGNGEREGFNILIDTGRLGSDGDAGSGQVIVDYMQRHGLAEGGPIEYLIVTHAHSDHYGGALTVMSAFDVRNVLDPGFDNNANTSYLGFLTVAENETGSNNGRVYRPALEALDIDTFEPNTIFGNEITVIFLNGEVELRTGDSRDDQINNTSIAMSLDYLGIRTLLMGDVYAEVEGEITRALPALRANILKVGHHGSTTSTSLEFLESIFAGVPLTRRFAVVQSGRQSFSGTTLPAPSIMARLSEFVPDGSLFTTQFDDGDRSESEAANDDHVQAVISEDGSVSICYVP
jgi:competence protein ComEC